MSDIIFTCDIDNTLLYSFRKNDEGFICIEINNGKEQGFMTEYTFNHFNRMTDSADLVPVTTRSVEQYLRIKWPNGFVPDYALVANGAVLLKNNKPDPSWNMFTDRTALCRLLGKTFHRYENDRRFIRCRIVDDSYVFVYCGSDTDPVHTAAELAVENELIVEESGKKIYFFPEGLSKGNAIKTFCKMRKYRKIIAAGDSTMDITMLQNADISIVPSDCGFTDMIHSKVIKCSEGVRFSDFVVRTVLSGKELFIK